MGLLGATLRYAAFVLGAIVVPGWTLQRLARVPPQIALVWPVGMAFAAGLYWLSLAGGVPGIFPAGLVAIALLLLWTRRGNAAPQSNAPTSQPGRTSLVAACAATVLLLALTQYPQNRLAVTDEFLLDPLVAFDTAFHVGLTRELTMGYPPQVPGIAGFPLGYHVGTDLVRAAALRWAHVDPYDAISRFDVTLGALALLLALDALLRRLDAPAFAIALAPWTLLLTDLSFVFAREPSAHWWADLLRGNLLFSLVYANPIVPALALLIGALIALAHFERGGHHGWLVLAAMQTLALPFFKVFLGAHLLLGLAALVLVRTRIPRSALAFLAVLCAVATAALAGGQGARTVEVVFAPLDLVRVTRESLALPPLHGIAFVGWAILWLLASLGLRALGIPDAIRALRSRSAVLVVLAVMALAAWPIGLLLRISAPQALEGQKVINDAAYLLEQGGALLWIFTCFSLARLASRFGRIGVVALVVTTSIPSTLQFAIKKATLAPDPLPAPIVRAMRTLESHTAPGDVVLQRPGARYPPAPVILAGRRVAYERFTPYLTQFARPEDLQRRHETVYRFFHTPDPEEARAIAASLGARAVCLYGTDRLRFPAPPWFQSIHDEPGAHCYTIR